MKNRVNRASSGAKKNLSFSSSGAKKNLSFSSSGAKKNNWFFTMRAEKELSAIRGEQTLVKQPTNHPLITHLLPTFGSRLDAIRKYAAMVVLMLFIGVGNAWGLDIYLDISSFTSWTPEQDGNFSLWDGSENIHSTNVATNLYKFTTSKTPATLYFKRKDSGSNEFSVTRSTTYNVYKVTGWNAGSCANYNISTVTKTNYIYFDNSTTNWSNSNRYFVIGHDKPSAYSMLYSMEALSNTKLWYLAQSSDNWSDATYYAVINPTSSWSGTSWGSSNLSSAAKYTSAYTGKYDMNSGSSYWLTPATASNGCSFTIGSSIPTYSATQGAKVRNTTNDSYSAVSGSSSFPATLKLQGTYIDGTSHKSARSTISASAANAGSANLTYTAVKTGLITHSYESLSGNYKFEGWGTGTTPSTTNASYEYNISANTTVYAFFTRKWQVTFGKGGTSGTSTVTATAGGSAISSGTKVVGGTQIVVTATPATGYEIVGWYSNSGCTTPYTSGSGGVTISADKSTFTLAGSSLSAAKTIYAKFQPKTYTVTLSYSGQANYGSAPSGVESSVTATYAAAMPTMGTAPKGAQGYGFYGYYTEANGNGTKYYNADGTSAKNWDLDANTTLYAYFKQAEISDITFTGESSVFDASGSSVEVTAKFDPEADGATVVCWRVLYSNNNPLESQPTFSPASGTTVSFNAPTTPGSYQIEATLRTGSVCGSGTVLSTYKEAFQIASDHTVTVQYKCGSDVIAASTTVSGKPLEWTEVVAHEIFGYSFSGWTAGDGITIEAAESGRLAALQTEDPTIVAVTKMKAIYDGKLTANYTQKNIIYFKNTLNWSDVYVNFYTGSYWNSTNGSGNNNVTNRNKHMTRLGETDIWYYDYGNISPSLYVSFTSSSQNGSENFWGSNPGVNVVYPANYQDAINTDKSSENGFKAATPMFVPLAGQTATVLNNKNNGKANYFNRGYWTKYTAGTGYTLEIYNSDGSSLLKTIEFTSTDELMPMKAVTDLEANTTYKFQLRRGGEGTAGIVYGNANTMTYSNHGQNTAWEMTNTSKAGITTTASGDYTFNLSYSANGSSQYRLRIAVDYPIKNRDYRLVYSDSKQTKPLTSAIVPKVNNGRDTVSFFVRPDQSPVMKIQQATVASDGAITWSAGTNVTSTAGLNSLSEAGVYNICLQMDGSGAISVENVEAYTGEFYIRTDAANSKWDNYRASDHVMTYSEYSETNSDFTHYWVKFVSQGTNVKFVVANDYSPNISDTLIQQTYRGGDKTHVDKNGFLSNPLDGEGVNIRYMWHRQTNAVIRAYLAPAQRDGSKFLVLRANSDTDLMAENGSALTSSNNHGAPNNSMQFTDDENWIYETTVMVKPGAYVKLYGHFHGTDFYFKGNNNNNFNSSIINGNPNAIQLITGSGAAQKVRVIFDFKTDRLLAAWLPSGEIDETKEINADVMFIREHQGDMAQLTFSGEGKITAIKSAYGVMRFNKYTLNNKDKNTHAVLGSPKSIYERSLYFISFPFRVKLNDVFGFGKYMEHWAIQKYNGARRAAEGFWLESSGFWEWMDRNTEYLEPNQGYLLAIDLDLLGEDNHAIWGPDSRSEQIELYFPSYGDMPNITSANVTQTIPSHACEIDWSERPNGHGGTLGPEYNRTIIDSHWNVLSVPTYVNTSNIAFANTTWTTAIGPNFLYTWNMDDNTLTATAAAGYTYHAMHAYMVQYGGNVTWSASSGSPYPIVARRTYAEKPKETSFCMEIQQEGKMIDRTYVVLSSDEETKTEFSFGEDMGKEFNTRNANIYTVVENYIPTAGNTLPMSEQTTVVPVGVKVNKAGEFTFAMPEGTEGTGAVLVDNTTGTRTNLALTDYTVTLEKGDCEGRFTLEISPVANTPTGNLTPALSQGDGEKVRKVIVDGVLYIVKDDKIYDARGNRIN